MTDALKAPAQRELVWAWDALQASTSCRSLVVVYGGRVMLQQGLAAEGCKPGKVSLGPLAQDVIKNGRANYLANLGFFPGKGWGFGVVSWRRAVGWWHKPCGRECL